MKVVIVDDSTFIRAIFKTNLGRYSSVTSILEAVDGRHGLQLLSANTDTKLLIVDLNMPNMGGLEFIRKLRSHSALSAIRVIVISSEISPTVVNELASLGVSDYVEKPFNLQNFISVVEPILEKLSGLKSVRHQELGSAELLSVFASEKPVINVSNEKIVFDFEHYTITVDPKLFIAQADVVAKLEDDGKVE